MTWTAGGVERIDPVGVGDERTTLTGFVEYHRATLLMKCAGLDGGQLVRRTTPPATLSLLGLVRHMTDVERIWFRRRVRGEAIAARYWTDEHPDGDFDLVGPAQAEEDLAAYVQECAISREVAAGLSLEDRFTFPHYSGQLSVRWLYVHLIEEYARHNGHADLIRQAIDGAVGE
jgi:uncharacterized damage-inducible protein DinB